MRVLEWGLGAILITMAMLVVGPMAGRLVRPRSADEAVVRTYAVADLVQPTGAGDQAQSGASKTDMDPLIDLLTATVAPGTWKTPGPPAADTTDGPTGTITPFLPARSLIVRHTPEVHKQIEERLRQLRRLAELQRRG